MKILLGISALIASLALAYFLAVYLPEQKKLEQQRTFQLEQEAKIREAKQNQDVIDCLKRGTETDMTMEQVKWYVEQCKELYGE